MKLRRQTITCQSTPTPYQEEDGFGIIITIHERHVKRLLDNTLYEVGFPDVKVIVTIEDRDPVPEWEGYRVFAPPRELLQDMLRGLVAMKGYPPHVIALATIKTAQEEGWIKE